LKPTHTLEWYAGIETVPYDDIKCQLSTLFTNYNARTYTNYKQPATTSCSITTALLSWVTHKHAMCQYCLLSYGWWWCTLWTGPARANVALAGDTECAEKSRSTLKS